MLKKVKKAILFSITAICLMMCSTSMVSAKECTCEQCQNQSALITAGPTTTPDILKQAEERAYKRFKKEQKKEKKKKEKKKEKEVGDIIGGMFLIMILIIFILVPILVFIFE